MQQQPQIPLVNLIIPVLALIPRIQNPDLRRQDPDLHLRAARIGPCARPGFNGDIITVASGAWFGFELLVRVVPAEGLDDTGDVGFGAVPAAAVGEADDSLHGF